MPFFDVTIPRTPSIKAFRVGAGRTNKVVADPAAVDAKRAADVPAASEVCSSTRTPKQFPHPPPRSRRLSWAMLGRSLAGPHAPSYHRQRRHSIQELGPWSLAPIEHHDVSEWSHETRTGIELARRLSVVEYEHDDGYGPERMSESEESASDSEHTMVPTDGSVTPANTLSRSSSYKKDVDGLDDDDDDW